MCAAAWRAKFRLWSSEVWLAAAPVLKKSLEPPTFTASEGCPANAAPEAATHWREAARAHALPQPRAEPQASVPTFDAFSSALASASGSAGFDGWEACELKALPNHLPELCTELYQLWCDTTRSEASAFVQAASSWKTVGLPKRGWVSAHIHRLLSLERLASGDPLIPFPCAPQGQWACKGGSVLAATAAFLTTPASAVAEIDLAKAFDSVDHSVAEAALLWHGPPIGAHLSPPRAPPS